MAVRASLLRNAGMDASEVGYMSVHGTGTPLGDPIELGALGQALSVAAGSQPEALVLGAVKSCYGHTEGAAGLTGALLAVSAISQQVRVVILIEISVHQHSTGLSPVMLDGDEDLVITCLQKLRGRNPALFLRPVSLVTLLKSAGVEAQAAAPIMHCRDLNPYVESALTDWRKSHRRPGQLPRTAAGGMACGSSPCAAGMQ